jgi:hypothetical protein
MLIKDIKDLILQSNVTISYTLKDDNQCADYLTKLGVSSNNDLLIYDAPPEDLLNLLRNDAICAFFPGE